MKKLHFGMECPVAGFGRKMVMKTASLFVAGLAIAIVSIAAANAAPKATDPILPGWRTKVLDPDVRGSAPANAKTYQECRERLKAQGMGSLNYQWYICSSMGYRS